MRLATKTENIRALTWYLFTTHFHLEIFRNFSSFCYFYQKLLPFGCVTYCLLKLNSRKLSLHLTCYFFFSFASLQYLEGLCFMKITEIFVLGRKNMVIPETQLSLRVNYYYYYSLY